MLTKTSQSATQLFLEAPPSLKVYDSILKIIEFLPSFLYYI